MKRIIVVFCLFLCGLGFGQNKKKIDSLLSELEKALVTSDSIIILDELAYTFRSNDFDKAIKYANLGLQITKGSYENKRHLFLNTLGVVYRKKNLPEKALVSYKKAEKLAIKYNQKNQLASCYVNQGVLYKNYSQIDSAISKYKLAEKTISFEEDSIRAKKIIVGVKNNLANIYFNNSELIKALEQFKELEQICLQYGFNEILADVYYNISNIHDDNFDYYKALDYSKKSLKYEILTNDNNGVAESYIAISSIFANLKSLDSSLYYLNKGIFLSEKIGYVKQQSFGYRKLGEHYLKIGNFPKALPNFERSLELSIKLENTKFLIFDYVYLAETNLHLDNLIEVKKNLKKAFKLMKDNTHKFRIKGHDVLMKYNYRIKNYKEAFANNKIRDSLLLINKVEETNKAIQDIETKYQTQQKENEILKLNNENSQKEAQLAQSILFNFSVLGVLILVLGIGYFFWHKRKQQHRLALLENSVKSSEAEKSRIGKELHDNIAGTLMKMVHDSEVAQIQLSHKLLKAYNEVRNLSHQLDNSPMHGELFFERVMDIIPENTEGKAFSFNISPNHLEIDEPFGTHIFRIIQELVTNNLKYAEATETSIDILAEDKQLIVTYKDNGKGVKQFKKGNGYKNIEDRIALMKGNIEVKTDDGFSVAINIPYTT